MAISFVAAAQGTPVAGNINQNYTVGSGSNRMLIVGLDDTTITGGLVTGVTYGGVAMTKAIEISALSNTTSIWYLANPASGSNAVVTTGTPVTLLPSFADYAGVSHGAVDNTTTNSGTGTSLTTSITTVADNCWTVLMARSTSGNMSAGTSTTSRNGADTFGLFDSNAAKTPAGSTSLQTTTTGSNSVVHAMLSMAPYVAPAAGHTKFLPLLGVG